MTRPLTTADLDALDTLARDLVAFGCNETPQDVPGHICTPADYQAGVVDAGRRLAAALDDMRERTAPADTESRVWVAVHDRHPVSIAATRNAAIALLDAHLKHIGRSGNDILEDDLGRAANLPSPGWFTPGFFQPERRDGTSLMRYYRDPSPADPERTTRQTVYEMPVLDVGFLENMRCRVALGATASATEPSTSGPTANTPKRPS